MRSPRLLLFFAVVCAVISVTPPADDWRFLVRLVPEWALFPNGYPLETPHEWVARVVVSGWHDLLQSAANIGWLTDARVAALIDDGLPVSGVLQAIAAILFVVSAFLWALASVRQPKGTAQTAIVPSVAEPIGIEKKTSPLFSSTAEFQEPMLATDSLLSQPTSLPTSVPIAGSISDRLADVELQLTNLLRDLSRDVSRQSETFTPTRD